MNFIARRFAVAVITLPRLTPRSNSYNLINLKIAELILAVIGYCYLAIILFMSDTVAW